MDTLKNNVMNINHQYVKVLSFGRLATYFNLINMKIFIFILACLGVGAFMGFKANSYYIFKEGNVTSLFSCAFSWLLEDEIPMKIAPLYTDVFMPAFGTWCGIILLIALFIYLDTEQKKLSRIGHEHGKARLGTARDFKKFKLSFMDSMTKK